MSDAPSDTRGVRVSKRGLVVPEQERSMRVFVAAFILASFAFALMVFGLMPPRAEAERGTVNVTANPTPCPAAAARWCHAVGGLAE
jgi:hypothetical protein